MMKLEDVLMSWLQARLVAEARPQDGAARETLDFFETILKEDHRLREFGIRSADDQSYVLEYVPEDGESRQWRVDREAAEWLLREIEANPKFSLDER